MLRIFGAAALSVALMAGTMFAHEPASLRPTEAGAFAPAVGPWKPPVDLAPTAEPALGEALPEPPSALHAPATTAPTELAPPVDSTPAVPEEPRFDDAPDAVAEPQSVVTPRAATPALDNLQRQPTPEAPAQETPTNAAHDPELLSGAARGEATPTGDVIEGYVASYGAFRIGGGKDEAMLMVSRKAPASSFFAHVPLSFVRFDRDPNTGVRGRLYRAEVEPGRVHFFLLGDGESSATERRVIAFDDHGKRMLTSPAVYSTDETSAPDASRSVLRPADER